MKTEEIFEKITGIVKPFVKSPEALAAISMETSFLKDLKVNSARLVDIVLSIEDTFGIEVKDDEADAVRTMGDAVKMVVAKTA